MASDAALRLCVRDPRRTTAFYRDLLGFQPIEQPEPGLRRDGLTLLFSVNPFDIPACENLSLYILVEPAELEQLWDKLYHDGEKYCRPLTLARNWFRTVDMERVRALVNSKDSDALHKLIRELGKQDPIQFEQALKNYIQQDPKLVEELHRLLAEPTSHLCEPPGFSQAIAPYLKAIAPFLLVELGHAGTPSQEPRHIYLRDPDGYRIEIRER